MDEIIASWLASEHHANVMASHDDACFALLCGSSLGGYHSSESMQHDYDIDYWTLQSFECDPTVKYSYQDDSGNELTHVDLYIHPLSCKFGKTYMMGYFNTINWRNLNASSPIWINERYKKIWEYCLSVKDQVSKAGMAVMIERCKDFIEGIISESTVVKQFDKNVYRLCGLCEDLELAKKDLSFLLRVKQCYKGISKEDENEARKQVKLVYDYMFEEQIDWKAFKKKFISDIESIAKECE